MMNVGGYHEYIWGCSVHRKDIMSTLGDVKYMYHDIPQCTEHPPMYL